MQDSTPTPDTSSRSLSLKTHRDREVARREARIGNNQTGGSEHHHRHHHHRQKSPDTSTSGDSDRDRHWRTILGHPPHTPSSSVRSGGNHPRPATEQRRGLPTPLRSPRSRSNATVPGGLPPPVRRRPADGLTDSSGRLPARAQPARPFACDQCVRRFERRGHLKSHVDAVHELQQPYACHYKGCQRSFSHRSSLNRHLKGVHHIYPVQERQSDRYFRQDPQTS